MVRSLPLNMDFTVNKESHHSFNSFFIESICQNIRLTTNEKKNDGKLLMDGFSNKTTPDTKNDM